MKGEPCVRLRKKIHGENYYIVIGRNFLHVTCPRENDPNMSHERRAIEEIQQAVNTIRGDQDENRNR